MTRKKFSIALSKDAQQYVRRSREEQEKGNERQSAYCEGFAHGIHQAKQDFLELFKNVKPRPR